MLVTSRAVRDHKIHYLVHRSLIMDPPKASLTLVDNDVLLLTGDQRFQLSSRHLIAPYWRDFPQIGQACGLYTMLIFVSMRFLNLSRASNRAKVSR